MVNDETIKEEIWRMLSGEDGFEPTDESVEFLCTLANSLEDTTFLHAILEFAEDKKLSCEGLLRLCERLPEGDERTEYERDFSRMAEYWNVQVRAAKAAIVETYGAEALEAR